MPTSLPELKPEIVNWYKQIQPKIVLDIGTGDGTYSDLLRRHDEIETSWLGVEVWAPYVNQYNLNKKYDALFIGDVRYLDFAKICHGVDLVILGDVLEHMSKRDALAVVDRLKWFVKNIIVSVPIGDCPQGAVGGNVFETHVATWTKDDLIELTGNGAKEILFGDKLGASWWSTK